MHPVSSCQVRRNQQQTQVRLHLVPSVEAACGDMNPAAVRLMCETLLNCGEGGRMGEEDVASLVGDALAHVGRGLCEAAVTESIAGLQAMRGIMQTYRMTGKDRFVASLLGAFGAWFLVHTTDRL